MNPSLHWHFHFHSRLSWVFFFFLNIAGLYRWVSIKIQTRSGAWPELEVRSAAGYISESGLRSKWSLNLILDVARPSGYLWRTGNPLRVKMPNLTAGINMCTVWYQKNNTEKKEGKNSLYDPSKNTHCNYIVHFEHWDFAGLSSDSFLSCHLAQKQKFRRQHLNAEP